MRSRLRKFVGGAGVGDRGLRQANGMRASACDSMSEA